MKSICIVVQNHYESDIRVRRKAEALVAAGYSVDVLALRSAHSPGPRYLLDGVQIHTVELGKERGSLFRYAFEYFAFFLWVFGKLFPLMRQRKYAVVDVNNLPDFLVFAAAYAKWRGAKIVFDMHEITPEFYISKYGVRENSWLVRLLKLVERASMRFADEVITINQPIQELLEGRGLARSKATIIMNSADDALFAADQSSAAAAKAARNGSPFVMMYHGTATRLYGLDIALQALSLARSRMPGAEFWILGDGPEMPRLRQQAQELGIGGQVKFPGRVLPQQIRGWLQQCDAGVLPTRQDVFLDFSFSNKLSEYVLLDKPVIASRLKAIRHYFSEAAMAFFDAHNAPELAKQMVRLFDDTALRRKLASRAKQEYQPINWSVMKGRYLELVSRLAGAEAPATVPAPQEAIAA